MNDVNEIQRRVKLVRNDMLERHPNCRHTIRILLWDDNTSLVECRHFRKVGEDPIICNSVYYDDELTYEEHLMDYDEIVIDGKGNEIRIN